MRINDAHPFMLMIEQIGRLKFAVLSETPSRFLAQSKVKGSVGIEDFEKKAIVRAGNIALATRVGDCPFHLSKRGKIINPWIKFTATTQMA